VHFAIQKLHWPPSEILEWVEADQHIKAVYYASLDLKAKSDKEESERIKRARGSRGSKRRR